MQPWDSISGTPSQWDLKIPGRRKFGNWKEICRHGKEADDPHFLWDRFEETGKQKMCVWRSRRTEKPG